MVFVNWEGRAYGGDWERDLALAWSLLGRPPHRWGLTPDGNLVLEESTRTTVPHEVREGTVVPLKDEEAALGQGGCLLKEEASSLTDLLEQIRQLV